MNFPLLTEEFRKELDLRLEKVRGAMRENHAEAAIAASSANIFYLSGGVCRGYFYIPLEGEPLIFMIPPAESSNPDVHYIRKPELIPEILRAAGVPQGATVALEFDDLYYSEVERLKKIFEGSAFCDASRIFRKARLVKTPYEISKMEEDGVKHCAVYSRIGHCYREGMTDLEFQTEIERVLRNEGCIGFLRVAGSRMEINMGQVLAGPNADVPSPYDFSMGGAGVDPSLPVGASGEILHGGMSVMVDMNGGFNGYQTDMTRCWAVGEVNDTARKAHECSHAILRDLEDYARPGVEIGSLYRRAREMAKADGLENYFMGHRHKASFIGHGIGIELNEAPVIIERNKDVLLENMTLAIEPKFVIPSVGAVGVENTYVVTPSGLRNLTPYQEGLSKL